MDWINGYRHTTLAFWSDEDSVSFEQLISIVALLSGTVYLSFLRVFGEGKPLIGPEKFLFMVLGPYIFLYYIVGDRGWFYRDIFAKFARLVLLHITLSTMFIAFEIFIKLGLGNLYKTGIAAVFTSTILYIHTKRIHKTLNHLYVSASALCLALISCLSIYFLILPR